MVPQVGRNERWLVAALLGAYWIALGWQAWHVGLTFDEPVRMVDSYLYWLHRPDLPPQDLPPLIKILAGWIPRSLHIPLSPESACWQGGDKQCVAMKILDRLSPARIQEVFYLMRLLLSTFAVATALLVWWWGRLLFGRNVALLLLVAALLSPTLRAHGSLANSDVPATFGYLLAAFCGWRFWLVPDRKNSILFGSSALLAMLAKMSMMIVPALALVVVLARAITGPRPVTKWLPLALASVTLIPYAGTIIAYKFDTRRLTSSDLAEMRAGKELPASVMPLAHIFRYLPTPREMQIGIRSLNPYNRPGPPFYMLGKLHPSGHWIYFPFALAVKMPIALQILFAGGLIVIAQRALARRTQAAECFVLAPAFAYLMLALQSNLQIGVRLVLPCIPFTFLAAGFAIERGLSTTRGRLGLAGVFAWLAAASVFIYPQGISYFNEWAGGPQNGWKYLADSNLDWGQNLPELAAYVRQNGLWGVKLCYFGSDNLQRFGIQDRIENQPLPWDPAYVSALRLRPSPGIYAISATVLTGKYFRPEYRDYLAYFRNRRPFDRVAYSILIFRVK